MERCSFSIKLSILLFSITAFFYYIIWNGYYMLGLSILPIIIYVFKSFRTLEKESIIWIVFAFFVCVSSCFSKSISSTRDFIFVLLVLLLFKLIVGNENGWQNFMSRCFFLFSFIHVIAVVLCLFIPETIQKINSFLYVQEDYDKYNLLFENGSFAGIAGQTAVAVYFISIFLAFSVSNLIKGNKKTVNIVFLIISLIALFITQKRSMLICNGVAIFFVFLIESKLNKHTAKKIFLLLFVGIVVFAIFNYIPQTNLILKKFEIYQELDDISNGRFELWKMSLDLWKKYPLFGIGAFTSHKIIGTSIHNDYIQVLSEIGIFGIITYITLLLYSFKESIKAYNFMTQDSSLPVAMKANYLVSIYMQIIFILYGFFDNPLYNITLFAPYVMFVTQFSAYKKGTK